MFARPLQRLAGSILLGLLAAGAAAGAERDWTAAVDANWFGPGNWSPLGAPDPNDLLRLDSGVARASMGVAIGSAGSVRISGAAVEMEDELAVHAGGTLSVAGGQLTVHSLDNGHGGALDLAGGTLTVRGGAYLPAPGNCSIAGPGRPELVLTGGATMNGSGACIIGDAPGRGVLTASGKGTSVCFDGEMGVGVLPFDDPNETAGALNVLDGATVLSSAGQSFVGHAPGAIGRVTVRGGGSAWQCEALTVGFWGSGTVLLEDGGLLKTDGGAVLAVYGAEGRVDVVGPGSRWETPQVTVGFFVGRGQVVVSGGGRLDTHALQLGSGAFAEGVLRISGAGSTVTIEPNALVTSWTCIGGQGRGTLTIDAGGALDSNTDIGLAMASTADMDASGEATIDGAGSRWTIRGGLYLGGSDTEDGNGAAAVTVRNGGELSVAGVLKLWNPKATLALDGGRITCGSLDNTRGGTLAIELGRTGGGTAGGVLAVDGNTHLGGTLALNWLPVAGDPSSKFGGAYDILTCGGELDGNFAAVAGNIGAAYIKSIELAAELGDGRHAVRVTLHDLLDGDADLDGFVGRDDLEALKAAFGSTGADWFAGDFDLDGQVDFLDYVLLKRNFGRAVGGAVPEPAALTLLALAAAGLIGGRRRGK